MLIALFSLPLAGLVSIIRLSRDSPEAGQNSKALSIDRAATQTLYSTASTRPGQRSLFFAWGAKR